MNKRQVFFLQIFKKLNFIFSSSEYGKPYLNEYPHIHFNISHSGDWVVCVVDNEPVGVDVEKIRIIDYEIAENWFSPFEFQVINNLQGNEKQVIFFNYWCMKESYIKSIGKGLSEPLNSFSIRQNDKIFYVCSHSKAINVIIKLFYLNENHVMALCAKHNFDFNNIVCLNAEELHQKFINLL